MESKPGRNLENKALNDFGWKWMIGLFVATTISALPVTASARDPGINQPGRAGNVGVPAVGRDPGINQPGAAGNVHRDPGINQPGAAGNVGAPGVGRDPGINQPGEAGNRRRVVR